VQIEPDKKYEFTQEVHVLVFVMQVRQLAVQSVQTYATETYPEGQLDEHV
jgi:hypothetical protein